MEEKVIEKLPKIYKRNGKALLGHVLEYIIEWK